MQFLRQKEDLGLEGLSFDYGAGRLDFDIVPPQNRSLKLFLEEQSVNSTLLPDLSADSNINLSCNRAIVALINESESPKTWLKSGFSKLELGTRLACPLIPEYKAFSVLNEFIQLLSSPQIEKNLLSDRAIPVLALAALACKALLSENIICKLETDETNRILKSFREIHPLLLYVPETGRLTYDREDIGLRKLASIFGSDTGFISGTGLVVGAKQAAYLKRAAIRVGFLYLEALMIEHNTPHDGRGQQGGSSNTKQGSSSFLKAA